METQTKCSFCDGLLVVVLRRTPAGYLNILECTTCHSEFGLAQEQRFVIEPGSTVIVQEIGADSSDPS